MPMIPMKQTITVVKAGNSDGWGGKVAGTSIPYTVRIQEGVSDVVSAFNASGAEGFNGQAEAATVTIFFDKLPDVQLEDKILYTNELRENFEYTPKSISVKRDFGGKPIFTVVLA